MTKKIEGIHSVDGKIFCSGHGSVNNNGSVTLMSGGSKVNNHSIPKLRRFTNKKEVVVDGAVKNVLIDVNDIDLSKTPAFVSPNCLRYHAFRRFVPHHLGKIDETHVEKMIDNPVGLLRGYAITASSPIMRKSPLLVEDLVNHSDAFNACEIFSMASTKDSETGGFYSKTTLGDTKYVGYFSLNIEEMQFIPCDSVYGRNAVGISYDEEDCKQFAEKITNNLKSWAEDLGLEASPNAVYDDCYVRIGTINGVGEAGILLDNDALAVLVEIMKSQFENLFIHQSRSWLALDDMILDFNDGKHFRIKKSEQNACDMGDKKFAVYYRPATAEERGNTKVARDNLATNGATRKEKKKKKQEYIDSKKDSQ